MSKQPDHKLRTATIFGYHGHHNLGDDIFRKVIFLWLGKSLKVRKCYVSATSGMSTHFKDGIHVIPFKSPLNHISRLIWCSIFKNAMRSDILVFSAGSIFTIQPFFEMYLTLRFLKLLRGKNLRIIAVGVSIGPFHTAHDKKWCLKALSLMDSVLVRDYQSRLIIDSTTTRIQAHTSFDLALCWNTTDLGFQSEQKPGLIGLATTERAFGKCLTDHTDNCNKLTQALEQILESSNEVKIRILSVCADERDGDNTISTHIFDLLKKKWGDRIEIVLYQDEEIDEVLRSISECKVLIAARMHAGIMGMLSSVPVCQISYAEKIRDFFIHTELSTQFLYDHDNFTQEAIYGFIDDGLSGNLVRFVTFQKNILARKKETVSYDLDNLARQILL